MITGILTALLVVTVIGVIAGVLLALASHFFKVEENETVKAVRECLPGANCGACGFAGCDAYAEAVAEGKAEANLCIPGGPDVAGQLSDVLGVEISVAEPKVAYVNCSGDCSAVSQKTIYEGIQSCKAATMAYGGPFSCKFGCIGLGDCVAVCPEQAIVLKDGIAKVISSDCLGCGLCAKTCPHGVIRIMKAENTVAVSCSNHDKGALTRKMCSNGCIGCTKCVRTCPNGAISMDNNLAVIDYEKCTNCGACAEACPVGAIHNSAFICDKCL